VLEVIDSVDLVVAALSAGAVAGLTDTASTVVKDAYEALKSLTRKALRQGDGDIDGQAKGLLDDRLADPEAYGEELREELAAAGAGADAELVSAAQKVLELIDPAEASVGKYQVEVRDSQGVQVGDGNIMTLNFEKE
jgi:hypothetical protein